ncbi:hypothetical protein [Candidatus Chloroploca sp. Khr17]|uniref:hypothetical protein n=1 Tax=Candidatus Chloroploca sp. Khr17 TaxID=2496869 RepID=UPI00101B83FA|nr:hypothetical protein [Candidatus Chloroploca sp. Khr17]
MNNVASNKPSSSSSPDAQHAAKPRKPYHTPRMEDYGAVNELTRSASYTGSFESDLALGYTSTAP